MTESAIVNANIPKLWHMVFKVFGYAKFSITTEPFNGTANLKETILKY
jgi:hypothetical protein